MSCGNPPFGPLCSHTARLIVTAVKISRATRTLWAIAAIAMGVTGVVALTPSPAAAHTFARLDRNDSRGRLDLKSVKVEHKKDDLVYTFTTYESWRANAYLRNSFFLIAIDHAQDGTPDRCAFITYYSGGLKGLFTNCRKRSFGALKVSKPSGTRARLILPNESESHQWLGATYWKGEGCKTGCWDYTPNRSWLLHDLDAPHVSWLTTNLETGNPSTALSLTTTVPIKFTATDPDTGVASWTLETVVASNVWDTVDSGIGGGTIQRDVVLEEGRAYKLRVSATDLQGNVGSTGASNLLNIVVPYDDANTAMSYSGGWAPAADPTYFFSTVRSTSTVGASVTFNFTTTSEGGVFLIGGPGDGTATPSRDGGIDSINISETASTEKGAALGTGLYLGAPGAHIVTLTVTSGTFILDGIEVAAL